MGVVGDFFFWKVGSPFCSDGWYLGIFMIFIRWFEYVWWYLSVFGDIWWYLQLCGVWCIMAILCCVHVVHDMCTCYLYEIAYIFQVLFLVAFTSSLDGVRSVARPSRNVGMRVLSAV